MHSGVVKSNQIMLNLLKAIGPGIIRIPQVRQNVKLCKAHISKIFETQAAAGILSDQKLVE
jgi:hypothetical protein